MRELAREPEVIFWVFFFPVALAVALGIAFREKPPDKIFVAVVDHDNAPRMADALNARPPLRAEVVPRDAAAREFRLGKVALVVSRTEGMADPVEFRYDPGRPDSLLARSLAEEALQRAAGRADRIAIREEKVSEPGARYIDFLIPGLLGMNLMSGGLWGIGYAVVDMRVKKLLKRLIATPMHRSDFVLALVSSRLLMMLAQTLILLLVGLLVFRMAVLGSIWSILLVGVIGSLCFSGLGLLVASRARKIETVSGLMNLVAVPMFVLSGVFFSSERFPEAVQPLIHALPLTALNDALRSVILEGAGLAAQGMRFAILGAWGAACFVLGLRLFRWQ